MNDLEKAVLDIIERRYKCKYTGQLKVQRLKSGGYKLSLDFDPEVSLIQIALDTDDPNVFLKYVEKELIERQLIKVEYFTGIKIYPEDETRGNCC